MPLLDPRSHLVGRVLLENLDSLYSTACRLTGRTDLAEDLVQETARKALKGSPNLENDRNVRGWLFTILVNSVRDHIRRGDGEPGELVQDRASQRLTLQWAAAQDVRRALAQLSPARRAVVVLVDIEEFTIAETAAMLELPPGTVASRLARAHRELRDRLQVYRSEAAQGGGQP